MPLRAFSIPIAPGSEPEPIEIDDLTIVYDDGGGDGVLYCDLSPSGQCEFSPADHYRRCIHCKREPA